MKPTLTPIANPRRDIRSARLSDPHAILIAWIVAACLYAFLNS